MAASWGGECRNDAENSTHKCEKDVAERGIEEIGSLRSDIELPT